MNDTIEQSRIPGILQQVNREFNVHLVAEDFKSMGYSASSLGDIIAQKVKDEKSGEWTADVAFHKLRTAIAAVTGKPESAITADTALNQLFPSSGRREQMKKLDAAMGFPVDALKPNGILYGFFIFCFFAGLPVFSLGWFPAILTMFISAVIIFILLKTANEFKAKTVGLMADRLAWKNYLKDKQASNTFSKDEVLRKIIPMLQA